MRIPLAVRLTGGLLSFLGILYVLFRSLRDRRFRATVLDRLRAPKEQANIWLHAASLGEVEGLIPVVLRLREAHLSSSLLITVTSATGKALVEKRFPEIRSAYLPLDLRFLVCRFLRKVSPRVIIIFETELWPQLCFEIRNHGIQALLVNGRISDRTAPRYQRFRWFFKEGILAFREILAQTPVDRERFVALGALPERVTVSSSTKFDIIRPPLSSEERAHLRQELGIRADRVLLVAGSVRPEELPIVLDGYLTAKAANPQLAVVIAPRHPERFDEAAELLTSRGVEFHRRKLGPALGEGDVVLLDTLGELRRIYGCGEIGFVGGSLVDIGGHNPLEPAMWGIPVLMGPYSQNVREVVSQLEQCGGLFTVRGSADLAEQILKRTGDYQSSGARAHAVWRSLSGGCDRVIESLKRVTEGVL